MIAWPSPTVPIQPPPHGGYGWPVLLLALGAGMFLAAAVVTARRVYVRRKRRKAAGPGRPLDGGMLTGREEISWDGIVAGLKPARDERSRP